MERWKFCPFDGTPLEAGWLHCPHCGAVIGQKAIEYVPYPVYPQVQPWNPITQPWITWGPNVAGSTTGIQLCGEPGRIVSGASVSGIVSGNYTPQPGDQITYTTYTA